MLRNALLLTFVLTLPCSAMAKELPGPKVKDVAPFNSTSVITGPSLACMNQYERSQLVTGKNAIVADVKECIRDYFGISKDIGLSFGSGGSDYAECVVPSSYEARPPSGNPMWTVCCAVELPNRKYRMSCQLYYTPR
jgi:hypothetical protein